MNSKYKGTKLHGEPNLIFLREVQIFSSKNSFLGENFAGCVVGRFEKYGEIIKFIVKLHTRNKN